MKKNSKNRFLRVLKRLIFLSVLIVLFFVVAGYFLGKLYENKIEKLVLNEINKNLNTEVTVKDISFSVLKDFPYATLLFNDVIAINKIGQTNNDTLLKAGSLFLNFNIIDLIRKNYILKNIVLKNASLNLQIYDDNSDNFHFFKTTEDTTHSSFSLSLNKVLLKNVVINFKDDPSVQDYSLFARDVTLKGQFSEKNYSLNIEGNVLVNNIISDKISYLNDQDARLKLLLKVDEINKQYNIEKGEVSFDKLFFDVSGSVIHNETNNDIDLKITGNDLELSSIIQKLPGKYKDYFRNLKATGRFNLLTRITGKSGKNNSPQILAEFNFEKGKIIHKKTSVAFDNVRFSGSYSNGQSGNSESSKLVINDFSAGLYEGNIRGNFTLSDFDNPEIMIVTDSKLDLAELQDFIKIDTIKNISGTMVINAKYQGKINDLKHFKAEDFINSTASGKMKIRNMSYQLIGDDKKYDNINADISFNNNDLLVDDLNVDVSGSDFKLKGYFRNFLPFVFIPGENLLVEAELDSKNIKLDNLLAKNSLNTDEGYKLNFSDRLEFDLDFNVQQLTFNKFKSENISGKIKIKNKKIEVTSLVLQAEDGITHASGYIDGTRANEILLACKAYIKNVNVKQLFYEFESFGQSGLTENNINGTINAEIDFSGVWNSSLKVDPASIYAKADIVIENGALMDYPPVMGLSDHIKDADLSNVKFSTLQNQIEINNEQIFIPGMEIRSDAIDIYGSGIHKFNNEINYHLRVLWSELKSGKKKEDESEFGVVIDDGLQKTTLFFVITGTLDNPIVKYDKKGVKDKIATDLKNEKKNLKKVFEDEFKKENSEREKEKEMISKQEKGNFIIEWEEQNEDSTKEEHTVNKKNKPGVFIEWDEEDNDTIKKK